MELIMTFQSNTRPGWMCHLMENALAYYSTVLITRVESFRAQNPEAVFLVVWDLSMNKLWAT